MSPSMSLGCAPGCASSCCCNNTLRKCVISYTAQLIILSVSWNMMPVAEVFEKNNGFSTTNFKLGDWSLTGQ